MTVTYMVGDVRERMADIADGSVSLVASSPPFLALRSYLPDDAEHKHAEIGSEPDPATFLDTLLELTAEWGRVLAPWGSLAIELGDSFSGSGGAGGDYADDGWRGGQAKFGGSASKARESRWSEADALWMAGVIDTEGSIIVHKQGRIYRTDACVAMMERQVCDRAAEIAGVGNVNQDGRGVYSWHVCAQQARYVLTNIWPHLLIKQRQAKAAIELQRHIEETRSRGGYNRLTDEDLAYREMIREFVSGLNARGDERGVYVPTWQPPCPPRIDHSQRRQIGWPRAKCLAMIPELYAVALAYGINPLTGQPSPAGQWLVRNVITWHRPNPAVGALGDKVRPSTSYITVATRSPKRWFDLDSVRTVGTEPGAVKTKTRNHSAANPSTGWTSDNALIVQNPAGAPPLDCWFDHHDTWTLTTQPSRISTTTTERVPCGPDDGGERTTSPDCPVHGDRPDPAPTEHGDERAGASSPHTPCTGSRPEPEQPPAGDCGASTSSRSDQPAANARSTSSSRTAPAPSTSQPDTPSAQTAARTGRTPASPESSGADPGTPESNSDEACPPADEPETAPHSDDTSGPSSACTCSFHLVKTSVHSHYAMWPAKLAERLILMMCPTEVCATCGEGRQRLTGKAQWPLRSTDPLINDGGKGGGPHGDRCKPDTTLGWSDCGHGDYRPGVVLDPFAGTFTTGAVAEFHGRDAIGIDIDARNRDLYPARRDEVFRALNPTHVQQVAGQLDIFGEGAA